MILLPKGEDALTDAVQRSLLTKKKTNSFSGSWFEHFEDGTRKTNNIAGIGSTLETKGKYINDAFLEVVKKKTIESLSWLMEDNHLTDVGVKVYLLNNLVYIDITSSKFNQQIIL